MSYFIECEENHLVSVNGISQLFPFPGETFKEKIVLIPSPTFGDYHRVFPGVSYYHDQVGMDLIALEEAKEETLCDTFLSEHRIYLKPVREKFTDDKYWMRFSVHKMINY